MAGLEELKRRLRPLALDANGSGAPPAGGLRDGGGEVRISFRVLKCALSFRNGFSFPKKKQRNGFGLCCCWVMVSTLDYLQ